MVVDCLLKSVNEEEQGLWVDTGAYYRWGTRSRIRGRGNKSGGVHNTVVPCTVT